MAQLPKEISEKEATDAPAALFLDIKRTMRVPIVNLLYRVWAGAGGALSLLWSTTRSNLQTIDFENKADSLRSEAVEELCYDIMVPSHRSHLHELGWSNVQVEQLQRELDVFHYINPKLLLHCALLRRALGLWGYRGSNQPLGQMEPGIPPAMPKEIAMVDPPSADPKVRQMLDEIRSRLKLPAVNSDYHALAKWPDYLHLAWADFRQYQGSPYYREHQKRLQHYSEDLVNGLPYSVRITSEDARSHGLTRNQLTEFVEPFLELLPGLILNFAFWKIALDGADQAKRSPFPVQMVVRV